MNWKDYEKEILEIFKSEYPNAQIKHDVQIQGRYSKTSRQVDLLIEDYVAGNRMKIAVDGKYFSSKIDVKDVEMFIGMLNDIDVHKGLLITQEGFSEAAIIRAFNDPTDLELDILNFKDLHEFQGFVGIPFAGDNMAVIPAPFGWVVDAKQRDGIIASLYQRGLTFEEAYTNYEWAYVNFWGKDEQIKNLEDLLLFQEKDTLSVHPTAKISYIDTVFRNDFKVKLRRIDYEMYPVPEYTGFIEFENFFFFCVLFTREELSKKNIRKLESILLNTQQGRVERDDILKGEIDSLDTQLKAAGNDSDRSDILVAQGNVFLKYNKFNEAIENYDRSLKLIPTCYGALKGKLKVAMVQNKPIKMYQDLIDSFFMLGPENPTVCLDILEIYPPLNPYQSAIDILKHQAEKFKSNGEAFGNMHFHLGHAYEELGKIDEAKKHFHIAQVSFNKSVTPDNEIHGIIDIILNRLQ